MNFSHAQSQLSEASPGMEFSRDEITRKMSERPLFSEEALDSIFKIEIEPHHSKLMNKAEKAFVEIGAFLTQKEDHIQEIGDYLSLERAQPGWIGERYDISLQTLQGVTENFNQLDQAQREAHEEAARKDAEAASSAGKFGNGYMTNEVVYDFGDGWKVVYVPAVGEGPNYKGDGKKSNDRTIEGNINGLCLGATQGLYQNNNSGKIYSVRDPKNNPAVTIRISDENYLLEAKGKNNLSPSVDGALHADKWFKTLDNLSYKSSHDYQAFPPLTIDDARSRFRNIGAKRFLLKGYATHWYRKGIDELDRRIDRYINFNDIDIIYSGLAKKYKELVEPVAKYWAEQWTDENDGNIFGNFDTLYFYHLSHESWKVYKKKPWMKAAIKKLMEERPQFGFKIGIHLISDYREYAEAEARNIAKDNPSDFFKLKLNESYPELERDAAETISINDFFKLGLYEKYPEFIKDKDLRRLSAKDFFKYNLSKDFPEIAREYVAASEEKWEYPDYQRPPAIDLDSFFINGVYKYVPDIANNWITRFVSRYPHNYFGYKIYIDYPGIKRKAAETLITNGGWHDIAAFFDANLDKDFPGLAYNAIKKVIEDNPSLFYELKLSKKFKTIGLKDDLAKDLEDKAMSSLANILEPLSHYQLFSTHKMDRIVRSIYQAYPRLEAFQKLFVISIRAKVYPFSVFQILNIDPNYNADEENNKSIWLKENIELAYKEDPVFVYNLFKFFRDSDNDRISEDFLRLLPEDFIENIPRIIAKEDPGLFFKDKLDEKNIEAKKDALKVMSRIDIAKWIDLSGYKKYYIDYMSGIADSSLDKIILQLNETGYLIENSIDRSSFAEFKNELFSNYLSAFIFPDEKILEEIDLDPEGSNKINLLQLTVDEDTIHSAVLGFVSWGIDNLLENTEEQIEEADFIDVRDILNQYIENFYPKAFSRTELKNAKRIGYNLKAELEGYSIKRDMQREYSSNIYEEEAEGIYQEEDAYNPIAEMFDSYDEDEEEYEQEEYDEEGLDKISKLYNYLVKSGFSKEAEILKEFTKTIVLKK